MAPVGMRKLSQPRLLIVLTIFVCSMVILSLVLSADLLAGRARGGRTREPRALAASVPLQKVQEAPQAAHAQPSELPTGIAAEQQPSAHAAHPQDGSSHPPAQQPAPGLADTSTGPAEADSDPGLPDGSAPGPESAAAELGIPADSDHVLPDGPAVGPESAAAEPGIPADRRNAKKDKRRAKMFEKLRARHAALSHGNPAHYTPPPGGPTLASVRDHNNITRSSVGLWLNVSDWRAPPSVFQYGLRQDYKIFHVSDEIEDNVAIAHDLVGLFGALLQRDGPLDYLEIGVSVGKCLYTQLNFLRPDARVFALDIETPNPTLAAMLNGPEIIDAWTDETLQQGKGTSRRADRLHSTDYVRRYRLPGRTGPLLTYVEVDEFSEEGWQRLARQGARFRMVLSDALHEQAAVEFEWGQLHKYGLLDLVGDFVMLWDDCLQDKSDSVRRGFSRFPEYLRKMYPGKRFCSGIVKVWGWMGKHEAAHPTCFITTYDVEELRRRDPLLGSLEMEALVTCA